jgi:hypothetical protein
MILHLERIPIRVGKHRTVRGNQCDTRPGLGYPGNPLLEAGIACRSGRMPLREMGEGVQLNESGVQVFLSQRPDDIGIHSQQDEQQQKEVNESKSPEESAFHKSQPDTQG